MRSLKYLVIVFTLLQVLIAQDVLGENIVTLYTDDGEAENAVWMNGSRGHSILYPAPCDNWTLSGVGIYGKMVVDSPSDIFVIEIWDENLTLLSRITDVSASFFGDELDWALVDIPDVTVPRNFLVNLYELGGVYVGVDKGVGSGRTLISARNPNRILEWNISSHQQNQTNWMIRAIGYSPEPQVKLNLSSHVVSSNNPAVINLELMDPDGNLKNAALYILSNESQEVVWSEIKSLKGSEAEVQFFWSGDELQISNSGLSVAPVFFTNVVGVSEDLGSYLAYSAPCILQVESGSSTIYGFAYFGDDGKFNALIDELGRVHYISKDVMSIISADIDYMDYVRNNTTIAEDESRIVIFNFMVFLK